MPSLLPSRRPALCVLALVAVLLGSWGRAQADAPAEAKAKGFHEQLRAFRERDKALNDALISAQQLRAETREQADREAQLILREARAEGERVLEEARGEIRRLQLDIDALERWAAKLGPGFRGVLAFVYHLSPTFEFPAGTPDVFAFRDGTYLMRAVAATDYRAAMRTRSPRWNTVHLPTAAFREVVKPFSHFLAGIESEAGERG